MSKELNQQLTIEDVDRIIEMAWEDRTPFEAIQSQFGLLEKEVIDLMRANLLGKSFKRWRERTNGRATKHQQTKSDEQQRFRCSRQRAISLNKISKR